MRGRAEVKSLRLYGFLQLAEDIAARSHLIRIPAGNTAFVHLKAVVVLRHRKYVARAGRFDKLRPLVRAEFFRPKQRNEILVAKYGMIAVCPPMILPLLLIPNIHIAGIPLIIVCRNAVKPPVNKNPELLPSEPCRHLHSCKRLPVVAVGSLPNHTRDPLKLLLHNRSLIFFL